MKSYPIDKTPYPLIVLVPIGVQVFVYLEIWQLNFPATNLVILRDRSEISDIGADVFYAKSKFADHSTKIGK